MPKTKQQKQEILTQLGEHFDKQQAVVFVDYKGLKVGDIVNLRKQLKEIGSKLVVAKKTLFARAMKEKGIDADLKAMEGQIGAIFAFEDSLIPLKTAYAFGKSNENLKIVGGYFKNQMQNATSMTAIALLPGREELFGQLAATMAAPLSGFMNVLQGNAKGLIVALNAIANKK